jgi:hypothetical protein
MADKALLYTSHRSSSYLLGRIPAVWRLNYLIYSVGVAIIRSGEEESYLSLCDREGIEVVRTLSDRVYKPIIRAFPFSAYISVVKRVFSSSSISSIYESNGGR